MNEQASDIHLYKSYLLLMPVEPGRAHLSLKFSRFSPEGRLLLQDRPAHPFPSNQKVLQLVVWRISCSMGDETKEVVFQEEVHQGDDVSFFLPLSWQEGRYRASFGFFHDETGDFRSYSVSNSIGNDSHVSVRPQPPSIDSLSIHSSDIFAAQTAPSALTAKCEQTFVDGLSSSCLSTGKTT